MSDNHTLKKESLKGGMWNFLTTIISQVRNFIVSLVLARLLTPQDFGLLGMAMVFSGFVDAFVDFGFGNAIIQRKQLNEKQISSAFYINLFMGFFFMLVMFFASGIIAKFFNQPQLSLIAKVLSISFVIKALETIPRALFKKNLDFKTPFKIQLITGICTGILGIVLALMGYGVWALVWSQVAGWIISTAMIWTLSNWRPILFFNINEIKELWNFGYKLSIQQCVDQVFSKIDTIVIGKLFSAASLGLYYRASSLNKLIGQYSFGAFSGVIYPSLCKINDNMDLLRHNLMRIIQVVCFTTFFFSGIMYVCSTEVIQILYGHKWDGAIPFFNILALFTIIYIIPPILVNPLLSIGKSGLTLKIEIAKKSLYLVSLPIGYFSGGLYGYVYAVQISGAVSMFINMWSMKYINLSMKTQVETIGYYMIPYITSMIFVKMVSHIVVFDNNILQFFFNGSLYFAIYCGFHGISRSQGFVSTLNLISLIRKKS